MATARFRAHPFLVLLIAAWLTGLASGLPGAVVTEAVTEGFGGTTGHIGIVIAAGTVIGTLLEKTGGAALMAHSVLRWIGKARSLLAMSVTGLFVSIPVFCDSGFVVLAPLNRSLARESGVSLASFTVALSMGLYAGHVFIPPTPGPLAAAGELGADIGLVMLLGLVVSAPVIAATWFFARIAGRRIVIAGEKSSAPSAEQSPEQSTAPSAENLLDKSADKTMDKSVDKIMDKTDGIYSGAASESVELRSAWMAFLPILLPVALIAAQSIASLPERPFGEGRLFALLRFVGDPDFALLLGVAAACAAVWRTGGRVRMEWISESLRTGGLIILITGAGGAFGKVLQATSIGDYLGELVGLAGLGAFSLLVPFLLAASLKTALGSSTVAIVTAASIAFPLLPALGLASGPGPVLTTLAIGAGSMTVSHANDSYFWVVSQFSGMTVSQAYKLHTAGSAVAGAAGILSILALGAVLG